MFRVASTSAGVDQVLFEAGGLTQGVAFILSDDQLRFHVNGDGANVDITTTLDGGWHQAVGVIDLASGGDAVSLYVDGQHLTTLTGQNVGDWAGGNSAGLGAGSSHVPGVGSGAGAPYHSLIAAARYYQDTAFSAGQVLQNYQSISLEPTQHGSVFSVDGVLSLSAGAVARLDVGDNSLSDKIVIDESLSLAGGGVEISYVGADGLAAGDAFDLLDFASASGTLGSLTLPLLNGGLMWRTGELLTSGVISVAIAGDYNGDGRVDAADYTVWRDQRGATLLTSADGNGDGQVDELDLTVWKLQFGQSAASAAARAASAAVPEPATAVILLAALAACVAPRRRRLRTDAGC
ncbi:hypothetical protein Pla175_22210 [Pirellulimonas nuda]|uniref:Dockerin domain-containing protein n=1 Tax=Pirellulimonas nuda TaxID=2528009 RepID=A0A518DBI0_9BACT|nr:LamG-like jellyroll fold domain-containing protein [Pirellulimonas nuda]QDU88837.1 hypothetical protein Pla175_22210 [Pirellulimonas nuda]